MIGARMPAIWLEQFAILASVPTLSRGAINEGTVHATGAAAESPPSARLIQQSAATALLGCAAPNIASPKPVPIINTDCRTRFALQPPRISASTSHPPTKRSANVANSQGALV